MPNIPQELSAHRRTIRRALLWKEWREQRWRFFLGTFVLSGLFAGLLRAQIIPRNEAALLIFWPVGLVMVIFLAMGSVAAERSDRTWEFLSAQPVSRAEVLLAKWRMGFLQLVGMITIATLAGVLAIWSRGFRRVPIFQEYHEDTISQKMVEVLTAQPVTHPLIWLCTFASIAMIALVCWYTPLFFILTRARHEFAAALGGILLTITLHVWLFHLFVYADAGIRVLFFTTLLNPLSALVLILDPKYEIWLPVLLLAHIWLWVILPLWFVRRAAERTITKWMGI